ncbi:MAG TPA: hypothetical protein VF553_18250 [Pyrinomonadaceae bacterium]
MEKEDITRAAEEAVKDLQLDCSITEITRPMGKDTWCIQFTGSYGQFCDEFHDKQGKENSARLVREKIKRFFLKQRKPTRIVRGRATSTRESRPQGDENLLDTIMRVGGEAIKQASRITGEVVERATNLNQSMLKAEADMLEGISPTAAGLIRPGSVEASRSIAPPPQRMVEPPSVQPRSQISQQLDAPPKRARQSAAVAKKASASQASPSRTAKKASAKKAGKSAAGKRSAKTTAKKAGGKKSRGKSRR